MSRRTHDIKRISYQPAKPYPYDLEIFLVSDLKRRTGAEAMQRTYSYAFYMLICVTKGQCVQLVDFEPISCGTGTLLAIRPGQAHNFGSDEDWDGWIMLVRPEFLSPAPSAAPDLRPVFDLERLPSPLMLSTGELNRAAQTISRIHDDSLIDTSSRSPAAEAEGPVRTGDLTAHIQALLRYQFYAFVTWLAIVYGQRTQEPLHLGSLGRFDRFKMLVEQRFAEWSQLSEYARHMGCTERSLTRATSEIAGISAKAFISRRISLEAKRLLAHTDLLVSVIAERLGFQEPTHFTKFFRRETGCTPSQFRTRNSPAPPGA